MRKYVFENSQICQELLKLGKASVYDHITSKRPIRHGYMAVVIKIANYLIKNKDKEDIAAILTSLGEEWNSFVEGEVKNSNESNARSLGGQ